MLYFLLDILILLGAFSVTAGMLGRYTYHRRLIFELKPWQRRLALGLGVLALVIGIVLYSYLNLMA
jgi:hypothetical protein